MRCSVPASTQTCRSAAATAPSSCRYADATLRSHWSSTACSASARCIVRRCRACWTARRAGKRCSTPAPACTGRPCGRLAVPAHREGCAAVQGAARPARRARPRQGRGRRAGRRQGRHGHRRNARRDLRVAARRRPRAPVPDPARCPVRNRAGRAACRRRGALRRCRPAPRRRPCRAVGVDACDTPVRDRRARRSDAACARPRGTFRRAGRRRGARGARDEPRRRRGAGVDRAGQGHEARWPQSAPAARVRRLRQRRGTIVLAAPPRLAGARRHLRQRPRARRRHARRRVAPCRLEVHQAEHVEGRHRGGRVADRQRLHVEGPARGAGRQRGGIFVGGRSPSARPVRRRGDRGRQCRLVALRDARERRRQRPRVRHRRPGRTSSGRSSR